MQGRSRADVYVLEDFRRGVVFDQLAAKPGDLSVWSRGIRVTPEGGISTRIGYTCVTPLWCDRVVASPAEFAFEYFFEHLNQIFWWERAAGGGVLLAATSQYYSPGRIYRFETRIPADVPPVSAAGETPVPGTVWPVPLDEDGIDSRSLEVECRNDDVYIDFCPYGDYCFVFDGVNTPLLIHPSLQVTPATAPIVGRGILTEPFGGGLLKGLSAGSYVYAFVPVVGKLGPTAVGFSKTTDDESFLTVSLAEVALDYKGNWRIPTYCGIGRDAWIQVTNLGGGGKAGWGGIVALRGFGNYFSSIPYLSAIRVYRTRASSAGEFWYVGEVQPGTDSFFDRVPDDALQERLDLDVLAPPRARLGHTFQDRLWVVGDLDTGDRNLVRFSERFRPLSFPESYLLYAPNLMAGDEIVRVISVGNELIFLLRHSILRLVGQTPADYALVPVSCSLGCVAPRTVARWKDGILFLSAEGPLYYSSSSGVQSLAGGLAGYWRRMPANLWQQAVGVASNDYYYLSLREDLYDEVGTTQRNNKVWACCLAHGAWTEATVLPFDGACQALDGQMFVSRHIRQGRVENGTSQGDLEEAGGVYQLREDMTHGWRVGQLWGQCNGLAGSCGPATAYSVYNYPEWMARKAEVIFEGIDCGRPGQVKVLDRIEIVYSGLINPQWNVEVRSDMMSHEVRWVPNIGETVDGEAQEAGWDHKILWNTNAYWDTVGVLDPADYVARQAALMSVKTQRVLCGVGERTDSGADVETSENPTGRTFVLRIYVGQMDPATAPYNPVENATIHRVLIYFHTEDAA